MANLTIPDQLYERIKALAAREQQSVEDYSIEALDSVVSESEQVNAAASRDEQLQRVREAMQGKVWTEDDVDAFFEALGLPEMTDEEAERIVADIPPLDPPLSQTVIEMREEARY
jgi:plasmid stability protein